MAYVPNDKRPFFGVLLRNTSKVKRMLDGLEDATVYTLYQGRLERLLVDRTKARFNELGDSDAYGGRSIAQTAPPHDTPWREASKDTLRTHPNPNRLLFDSGELQRSITASRKRLVGSQLKSPTGARFSIGIRSGSPAAEYGRFHQEGIPGRLPQRKFLGISDADVTAVDQWIYRNFKKFGIRAGI